jgi:hypothetical protein
MEMPIEELRKRKIFVATPMYGGQCSGLYTKACVDLSAMSVKYGVDMKFFYLFNESLVTRARNYLVDEFLRSDYTHLMFIDSDIHFNPNDVFALAAIADPDSDRDIVCGPYPKKCIAWERIVAAVKAGMADKDPAFLEQIVGDFVFNPVGDSNQIAIGEPVEVLEGGTGFMMIQRRVFKKWDEKYPEFQYTPDHNRSEHFDGTRKIMAYFDTLIEPVHNRYLSEDYMFCQWSRNIGLKIFMCPWMQMGHMGSYNFSGNIPAIAQVPGATHGGMLGSAPAKAGAPIFPGQITQPPAPILAPPPPLMGVPAEGADAATLQDRATRRREAAVKRREEKKSKTKKKKAASGKK